MPLITFLYVFLSSLITLGNVSVMLAVISTPTLRKATNFSLVSLAAADLFVGIVVLPLRILEAWTAFYWSRTTSWCKFSLGLTLLSLSASVLNLCIVTAERYFAIILPLLYHRKMTARRIFWALIFVWIVAILLSFSPFLGLKSSIVQERNHQHKICRFADTMSAEYLTTFACITVLMPTLFISFAYVRMYRAASKLKRRLKSLQVQPSRGQEITSALKESKSAKTIGESALKLFINYIHCNYKRNLLCDTESRFNMVDGSGPSMLKIRNYLNNELHVGLTIVKATLLFLQILLLF